MGQAEREIMEGVGEVKVDFKWTPIPSNIKTCAKRPPIFYRILIVENVKNWQ